MDTNIPKDLFEVNKPYLNPLIGRLQGDTICNVHDAIVFLSTMCKNEEILLVDGASMGHFYLSLCMSKALKFEMECRKTYDAIDKEEEQEEKDEEDDTTKNVEAIHTIQHTP